MSHTMNGNPIWCKPARTREHDFSKTEADDAEQNLSLLAEAASLVRAAMAKGLIERGAPHIVEDEKPGPRSEWVTCGCGEKYIRKIGGYEKCFQCRTPAIACKCCGKMFHPPKYRQVSCSNACRIALLKEGGAAHKKDRPLLDCPICGNKFPMRFHGGKCAKTCSRNCAIQLMIHTQKQQRNK